MHLFRRALGKWLVLALVAPIAATGCSFSGKGTVSGKVYYKKTLLKGGNVTFFSTEGKPSLSTSIAEDGSYKLEKVPTGEVTICVETKSLKLQPGATPPPKYSAPPGAPAGYTPPNVADRSKNFVPIDEKYATPEDSGKKYTVKSGSQEYNIELD